MTNSTKVCYQLGIEKKKKIRDRHAWIHFLQIFVSHDKNTIFHSHHDQRHSSNVLKWTKQRKINASVWGKRWSACRQTVQWINNQRITNSLSPPSKYHPSHNTTQLEREIQFIISPTRRWRLCVLSQSSTQFSPSAGCVSDPQEWKWPSVSALHALAGLRLTSALFFISMGWQKCWGISLLCA